MDSVILLKELSNIRAVYYLSPVNGFCDSPQGALQYQSGVLFVPC